ncbi:MAG: DNA-directed RNA polymerase subunit D [Nanoarchaeota archaeon]
MVDLKIDGEKSVFVFKDTHNSVVNAIRRIVLDEVPTFAIEDVEIIANESPLYDETLAHRLGLIPLKTDLKSYNFKENCSCGGVGCALCEVKMALSADEEGYVYSGQIKSDDPQVVPVDEKIPVTKIVKGKKVEANMKAILGKGREHAKWAPAHAYMKENENSLELIVEPFGQLDAKEVYNKSLDILKEKIEELEKGL